MKPKRPRPRQDRARQIVEAVERMLRVAGRPGPAKDERLAIGGGFTVSMYNSGLDEFIVDIWIGHKRFSCELLIGRGYT